MVYERIVKTFYDKLEEGVVLGRQCPRCKAVEFPPHIMCNSCGNLDTEWYEMSCDAFLTTVWELGMLSTAPQNEQYQPYALGTVRMKEGSELVGIICGVTDDNIDTLKENLKKNIPVPLKLRIAPHPEDGYSSFVFDLVEE